MYNNFLNLQTISHIAKLRKEKQAKEFLELSTRNYPSKHSQQIIQKLYQTVKFSYNQTNYQKTLKYSLKQLLIKQLVTGVTYLQKIGFLLGLIN